MRALLILALIAVPALVFGPWQLGALWILILVFAAITAADVEVRWE